MERLGSVQTRKRYALAVLEFMSWCEAHGEDTIDTVEELDELLNDYFHFLLEEGVGKTKVTSTLCGVMAFAPSTKKKLPIAETALKALRKRQPTISYPPISWELAVVVAVQLVCMGKRDMGIAVLLAFDGMLRISEVCGLMVEDLASSGDVRLGGFFRGLSGRLRQTKTGPNQYFRCVNPEVVRLVGQRMAGRSSGRLFAFSASQLRYAFKKACRALGIPMYVFHSLRHGGATHKFLRGGPEGNVENILVDGRWKSTTSARTYIQNGRAMALSVAIPVPLAEYAARAAPRVLEYFGMKM